MNIGSIIRFIKPETAFAVAKTIAPLIGKNMSPDLKSRVQKDLADWNKLADETINPFDDLFVSVVKYEANFIL